MYHILVVLFITGTVTPMKIELKGPKSKQECQKARKAMDMIYKNSSLYVYDSKCVRVFVETIGE